MRNRPVAEKSCRKGRRGGGCVGTWLEVAAVGVLAFFAAGAAASDRSMRVGGMEKYGGLREISDNIRLQLAALRSQVGGEESQLSKEVNSVPPKPLEVFEYGPSRQAWMRDPEKYKYQYVCVVATRATVEEGIWHKRQAPRMWSRQPPFHVRIVRPNPVGMLGHMLGTGKIKFAQKDVTMRKTDKRTGRSIEITQPMTVLKRMDGKLPKNVQEMMEAQEEGREYTGTSRPSKGRWGPSNIEEVKETGVLDLLRQADINTPEEADDVTKMVDLQTGKKYDMKRYFDYANTKRGHKNLAKVDRKTRARRARLEKQGNKQG
ncbi:unnamed protein product [Ectocarpus sp. 6 AP-2014]